MKLLSFFLAQLPSCYLVYSLFLDFFFSALSISEVFEDYISENGLKNVANRALYLSAIVIPLITILILFNLN
jgi:succinate dehydrogenase / fumarate reductase membrane anchor subunit